MGVLCNFFPFLMVEGHDGVAECSLAKLRMQQLTACVEIRG